MRVADVMLGLVGLAAGGFWVFFSVLVFQHDADARTCYIAGFFGVVGFVCLGALVCRHFMRRLDHIDKQLENAKRKD